MVYHVVSTKLTDDEHKALLEICKKHDCTPFQFIKESVKRSINEIIEAENPKKNTTEKPSSKKKSISKKQSKSASSQKLKRISKTSTNSEELIIQEEYSKISDVQELIKIYANLREKDNLSEYDISKLTVLHKIITDKMAK